MHAVTQKMKLLLILALGLTGTFAEVISTNPQESSQPNIIFLLTDDQDVTAYSLDYMPKLNKLLRDEGMEFVNYFVSTGLCCPSRATIIRGQFCHNTKIWDNGDLNNDTHLSGGFKKAMSEGLQDATIATQMKKAGYETFLIGKYLNGYGGGNAAYVPPGWDHWYGMTSMAYFGPQFSVNGKLLKTSKDTYQTDFIGENALSLLKNRDKSKPFFIYIAPFAPHAPSLPAPRHAKLFSNMTAPRNPSYNPDDKLQQQKPSWLKRLPKLDSSQVDNIDNFYRNRLRALQAVDELLENLTSFIDKEDIKDNTYLFYMGDNGQHLGDYRLATGKRQAYDTDIRVPFLARGPGIEGGTTVTEVVQSVDLLPTWIDLGQGKLPESYDPDGKSIVPLLKGPTPSDPGVNTFRAVGLAEMYGGSSNMGGEYKGMAGFEHNRFWNNTYQAIRVINGSDWAENANWMYAEWCTGEKEFYNLTEDPHEIYNIIDKVDSTLLKKLSVLTETLGQCAGKDCTNIDLQEISRIARETNARAEKLQCFNPPDMPGDRKEIELVDLASSLKFEALEDKEKLRLCKQVLANGFPYSDSDVVPEKALDMWEWCTVNS